MSSSPAAASITQKDISQILSRYADVLPSPLKALDVIRYETIPAAVEKRKAEGDAYLSKPEVESLVQWKIKHGKFRPTLPKLVASNDAAVVEETTRRAFEHYSSNPDSPEAAVKILNELRGIGPATSSLLLSVYDLRSCPFFSDEFFRYMLWDLPGTPKGWDRKLKYDMKELSIFYKQVGKLVERLSKEDSEEFRVVDVEKMAFVLGKEKADICADEIGESKVEKAEASNKRKLEDKPKANTAKKREKK